MELWFHEYHTPDVSTAAGHPQLYSQKSNYQQIDIYDTPGIRQGADPGRQLMLTERMSSFTTR
jgi:spermidine synthase